MKITAIIDDALVNDVKRFSNSKTTTEAITLALQEWLDMYHLKELNREISKKPFAPGPARKPKETGRPK
ncbi:type II toxin-antitoxin system VapB family antitoxin [Brucepastera parasyntrophica]|uniref:type II toxin-antitoxin system VapB family antitoxin n=1 Tax=Brucepastera parasyntrophica TaxID=2880008 RepID=UPI00210882B1|nr:type II toxin-antitoxin system VapB family antitoxin [Brucepastera parasyntrophica]ULQ58995.1 type II toxin-antitoxin system VapB family antitoxin [Brucepastera parasyntrophica]